MLSLSGKVAIVTGGASGIGRASVTGMAAAGAAVVVADRNATGAEEVADDIRSRGGIAISHEVDVSDPEQVASTVARAADEFGGVDILHNNAAAIDLRGRDTDVVTIDVGVWERVLAVNLTGPMLGCRFAIPEMMKRGGGSIIMTSSGVGALANIDGVAYGTSKGGMNSLVRHIATAFGKAGIRCNAVAPGLVLTPAALARYPAEAIAAWEAHHAAPRIPTAEDVAAVVTFLASDETALLTGQIITVDGGLSCHLPTFAEALRARSSNPSQSAARS